jgi:SAM-dependent methyltransferase
VGVFQLPDSLATAAYDPFAELYDAFTWDHDYERWVSILEGVALRHGHEGARLLDVACGTGKSLIPWLERGYEVVGCDLSAPMLERAAAKTRLRARLELADMRGLPDVGPRDLITCLGDSVNYLLDPPDLTAAFGCVAERLRPGGLYLFDLNSLRTYRQDFSETRRFQRDAWDFVWTGDGDGRAKAGEVSSATIRARRAASSEPPAMTSRHVQRHHPIAQVRASLEVAGLEALHVYGQHRDGSLDSEFAELGHSKALIVARRPAIR